MGNGKMVKDPDMAKCSGQMEHTIPVNGLIMNLMDMVK